MAGSLFKVTVGAVIALATTWVVYRTVVYDPAADWDCVIAIG